MGIPMYFLKYLMGPFCLPQDILVLACKIVCLLIEYVLVLFVFTCEMAFSPGGTDNNRYKGYQSLCHFNKVMICFVVWGDASFDRMKSVLQGSFIITVEGHRTFRNMVVLTASIN